MKTVLVADDEHHMVSLLKDIIETDDVQVIGVYNGQDAVDYVDKCRVDVVLTDVSMPKLSGGRLIDELHKRDPFMQIIVVTAYPDPAEFVEMTNCGANDLIVKPFQIERVRQVVSQALDKVERSAHMRQEWIDKIQRADRSTIAER